MHPKIKLRSYLRLCFKMCNSVEVTNCGRCMESLKLLRTFVSESLGQTNENFVASRECCLSKVSVLFFSCQLLHVSASVSFDSYLRVSCWPGLLVEKTICIHRFH